MRHSYFLRTKFLKIVVPVCGIHKLYSIEIHRLNLHGIPQMGEIMARVVPVSLDETLRKLLDLRTQREKRDYWAYSESLLDAAKTLRTRFGGWIDSEVADLIAQAELLLPVSDGQAREKLQALRSELKEMQGKKIPDAKSKLQEFIRRMQDKSFARTSEVIQAVIDYLYPSVSVIMRMNEARSEIDSMADMTLAIGGSVEISPEEKRDVEMSLREIREGKARTVRDVDSLLRDLKAD